MITKDLSILKINRMSEEQYQQAKTNGTISEDEFYLTPDENELDTTQFLRVVDVGSAVDPNPINANMLDGKEANEFVTKTDIVDDLTTTDSSKVLSAKQGAALKSSVDNKAPITSPTFTGTPKTSANTSYTTAQLRNITLSTANPSGGSNGDIWIKYTN